MNSTATVAVFGGSGRTGIHTLEALLAAGFSVRAQARNPASIKLQHPRLQVLAGEFNDPAAIDRVIEGADAVINLVGHVKNSPPTLLTLGVGYVLASMQRHNIRRIVNLTGAGVPHPSDKPKFVDRVLRFVMNNFFTAMIEDAKHSTRLLRQSTLDYTNIRAPRLVDDAAKGNFQTGYVGQINTAITRADLATFVVRVLSKDEYIRDEPAVSN